jgi:hypothetical protein
VIFKTEDCLFAWAGGLFDGEGTISLSKNKIRVSIHMTDLDILDTFKNNFGGSILSCKKQQSHHKESWKWLLTSNKSSYLFLKKIEPFLHSRRSERLKEAESIYIEFEKVQHEKYQYVKNLREKVNFLHKSGLSHNNIASQLKVSRSYVTHILLGKYD